MNFKQIKAIEAKNKQRILNVCNATEQSGIYIFTRPVTHCYIGQAKNLLNRLASHLNNFDRIDLSIKSHGLYSENNPTGWKIQVIGCNNLDEKETELIERALKDDGILLYNKQSGGQGKGKTKIADYKPAKGYRDGLKQGYKNAKRDVGKWVKHLTIDCDRGKQRAVTALEKFNEFLGGE